MPNSPIRVAAPLLLALAANAQGFGPPPTPTGNPTTAAKASLGKALFWDEQLSSTRTVACGTCHVFARGGADPRAGTALAPGADGMLGTVDDVRGSPGVPQSDAAGGYVPTPAFGLDPQVTPRLAPSVVNAAYLAELFWDGRARSPVFRDPLSNVVVLADNAALENLVAQPPVNTIEMGHLGRNWADVAARIAGARPLALADSVPPALVAFLGANTYPQLFQLAFGSPGVTPARIVMAIAAYLRTLVADQSPVDRFVLTGSPQLSLPVQRGLGVFLRSCAACHQNVVVFPGGGPDILDFRNTGIRPIGEDLGRFNVTGATADRGVFKVPDLRNAALRRRFFHNGGAADLGAVIDFYNRGGDFHAGQDPQVTAITGTITPGDRTDLLAFLQALTDPRVQNETAPFDRPRLYTESPRPPQPFGQATGAPAPRALALEPPLLGNPSFTLALADGAAGGFAVLFADVAANVAGIPFLGIQVHLAGTAAFTPVTVVALAGGPGGGSASVPLPLPQDPQLQGQTVYLQWAVFAPAGSLQASAGIGVTFF